MPDFATFFLGALFVAAVLGWAYERQRNAERERERRERDAAIATAIATLKGDLKRDAEYEATVKALGMMRNVAETRAAEPASLQPIRERILAEGELFALAEQRDLHSDIRKLIGKGDAK